MTPEAECNIKDADGVELATILQSFYSFHVRTQLEENW